MSEASLIQLYSEHTGKVSDKWSLYLTEYDRLFSGYRNEPVRLLEIGVQNGGSLEIWSKYFHKALSFTGCDINPDCACLSYDDPRIGIVIGDANAPEVFDRILHCSSQFDIIIDDGSHVSSDIIKSFALYFPKLADGGLFIAEDLHCSYWSQFEGGLFDPYSSISFFKRLADVINHEHWGIPKACTDILRGTFSKYGCEIDTEALSKIHSVEFINSMCVVRKAPLTNNGLGRRVIAGLVEDVKSGHRQLSDQRYQTDFPFDQTSNPWTTRTTPPDEAIQQMELSLANARQQIASLKQVLVERDGQIAALHTSISWRVTWPLRSISHQFGRIKQILSLLPNTVTRSGGLKNTVRKALRLYQREGITGITRGLKVIAAAGDSGVFGRNNYSEWIRRYNTLTDDARAAMRTRIGDFVNRPLISVVMPTYNTKAQWLTEAIESVRNQLYPHWELCIADDASTDKAVRPLLERYAHEDARIKVVFRETNGHISAASNSALELATGKFVALLDHDDELPEHALYMVALAIEDAPELNLIYSDEDKIDERGRRFGPYFKPDWNPDLLNAQNMISHLGVYRTEVIKSIGGFRSGVEGSQDWDLALRVVEQIPSTTIRHIPDVLYHWRAISGSTALGHEEKSYVVSASQQVVREHLQRISQSASVESAFSSFVRVRYPVPTPAPLVSVILLGDLIKSEELIRRTRYPALEIIPCPRDNDDNLAEAMNRAARQSRGELLCFLDAGLLPEAGDWLEELAGQAGRPGIGAVGPMQLDAAGNIQGALTVLCGAYGGNRVSWSFYQSMHPQEKGVAGRAALQQNVTVLAQGCLILRTETFQAVNGFDAKNFPNELFELDLCLRLVEAGYRNVWTPYARMVSTGALSTCFEACNQHEAALFRKQWRGFIDHDPAHNPNLACSGEWPLPAFPPRIDRPWRK